MPRGGGRSSSRSSGFGSRSSRSASPSYSPPRRSTPVTSAPSSNPLTQTRPGGMMGGIGSTIVQGMAFGAGSEVGHSVVRNMMGGSSDHGNSQPQEQVPTNTSNNVNTSNTQNVFFFFN